MDSKARSRPITIDARYALRRVLSQSRRSRVFLAEDVLGSNREVVIKVLDPPPRASGSRALEPFADRVAILHPNINPVVNFGVVKRIESTTDTAPTDPASIPTELQPKVGDLFLAFPYVRGGDLWELSQRFLATKPTSEALDLWLTGVSLQILEGLRALHDLSRLHYDLKPEHVLVSEPGLLADDIAQLVLIDLGLSDRLSTPLGNRIRGTRPFMAPEVLTSSIVDHRIDLYSFGATLYHCLSGGALLPLPQEDDEDSPLNSSPFAAPESWPHLADLKPELPEFWSSSIHRLLSRNPDQRHASAAVLVAEIQARPAARGLREIPPPRWPIEHGIGQEREFDYVARELEKLQFGEHDSGILLLNGEVGVGRRAVARRLADLAVLQGIELIQTQCGDQIEPPLAPLVRILKQIRNSHGISSNLITSLEHYVRWIDLGQHPPEEHTPRLRERSLEHRRFIGGLAQLVASLSAESSYLIVIEDLHRASPELIEILGLISQQIAPEANLDVVPSEEEPKPVPRVLLLGTVDDSAKDASTHPVRDRTLTMASLERQPGVSRVVLKPLNPRRASELLRDTLGPFHIPSGVLNSLHAAARGMSRTLLSSLREAQLFGFLERTEHGWLWNGPNDAPSALDMKRKEEAASLSVAAQSALLLMTIVGDDVDELAFRDGWTAICRDIGPDHDDPFPDADTILETLSQHGWVERRPRSNALTLRRSIPELETHDLRRAVLRSFATTSLQRNSHNPYAAIRLFAEAGDLDAIAPLLPRAVDGLRAAYCDPTTIELLEDLIRRGVKVSAELQLELASALIELGLVAAARERLDEILDEDCTPATEAKVRIASARLLRRDGEWSRARQRLAEALSVLEATQEPAELIRGEALLELGTIEAAEGLTDAAIDAALRAEEQAGLDPSEELLALRCRIRLFLHDRYVQQGLSERAQTAITSLLEEAGPTLQPSWHARLLDRLALFEYKHGRYEQALEHWGTTQTACESMGDTLSLANTLSNLGRVHTNRGDLDLATRYYQRSLTCLHQLDHRHGIAVTHNNMGQVLKLRNRLDDAEACFRRALQIWGDIGQQDSLQALALNNLSELLMYRGDYARALEHSLRALEIRKALENPTDIAFSYYRLAKIYRNQGELDRAADYAEKSLEIRRGLGDKNSLAFSLQILGELHILRGRYFEGFRCMRQSQSNFDAVGNKLGRATLLISFATTYCEIGAFEEAEDAAIQARELVKDQEAHLAGVATTVLGRIRLARGALSEAESSLSEAEQHFRSHGGRRELAEALLVKARLTQEIGHRERSETALAEAYAHIDELGLLDLTPTYYRLRGELLGLQPQPDLRVAEKLLERGLEESRRLGLAAETWRILFALANIALELGRPNEAHEYAAEALDLLRDLQTRIPAPFNDEFLNTPGRAESIRNWESRLAESAPSSPADDTDDPPRVAPSSRQSARSVAGDDPVASQTLTTDLLRLQDITLLLATERDPETLLQRILDAVIELFQAERGYLILIDGDDHVIRAARNVDREEVDRPEFKYSQSIAREVAQSGRIFVTNDAQNDDRLTDTQSVHDLRLQAIACFPLESLRNRLGVIYLENRFRKQLIPDDKIPLLEAFSSQAAVSLANALLIAENESKRAELEKSKLRIEQLNEALEHRVEEQSRQLEYAQLEIRRKQNQLEDRFQFHNIIGACPQMQQLYRVLDRVAGTDLPILIEGESGTGKELVARALHYHADNHRSEKPFISENCGAVAESLFESELFGHVRGSFTGADRDRQGLFALAESGTLFLDEIHELSLGVQRKLLRVLQESEYRPVGSTEFVKSNVRLLSACNQPLAQLVQNGDFREDLYYRLNVIKIELPPLRERGNDVILLARHFLERVVESESLGPKELSPAALRSLLSFDFPGNVRELSNLVEKAAVLSPHREIQPDDLFVGGGAPESSQSEISIERPLVNLPLREAKEAFQQRYLEGLLEQNDGVVARAARAAGVTRESLHRLLKKHGLR